jgi:hypothetical protein
MLGVVLRPRGRGYDSAAYRRNSLDCRMALLAIQQELGILSERRLGADSAHPFNPSSRRAVVALIFLLPSDALLYGVVATFRQPGDSALLSLKTYL